MMKKRSLFLISMVILISFISLISVQNLPQTQQECEEANADWKIISPENSETISTCICEEYNSAGIQNGFWNGTYCIEYNEEIRCEKTDGVWIDDECLCEGGEWVRGVGCQFVEHENPVLLYLLILLIFLMIILFILILFVKRRRKK